MAHQFSSESDDHIPSQPLDLSSPYPSEYMIINMKQQQQQQEDPLSLSNLNNDDDTDRDKDVTENPSASETLLCNEEKMTVEDSSATIIAGESSTVAEDSGRERLKQHRVEVAGRVWIPEIWGQEELLKDWIDCTAFDAPLVPSRISTARESLVEECTRVNAAVLRVENRC